MNKTKYLKSECQHCGGHLEFLADHIGMVVPCPHCQQETELLLAQPPEESAVPLRAIVWTIIAILILGGGLAGALIALKRAQKFAERQKSQVASAASVPSAEPATNGAPSLEQTNAFTNDGLVTSSVRLDKTQGTSLIYAVGTIKNTSERQRFGVKVEVELSDARGQKLGTASDYRQVLDSGAEWQFKALVVDHKSTAAKITAIREDK